MGAGVGTGVGGIGVGGAGVGASGVLVLEISSLALFEYVLIAETENVLLAEAVADFVKLKLDEFVIIEEILSETVAVEV